MAYSLSNNRAKITLIGQLLLKSLVEVGWYCFLQHISVCTRINHHNFEP